MLLFAEPTIRTHNRKANPSQRRLPERGERKGREGSVSITGRRLILDARVALFHTNLVESIRRLKLALGDGKRMGKGERGATQKGQQKKGGKGEVKQK